MTEDLIIDLCALHSARVKELEAMEEEYARQQGIDRAELRKLSSPHYMRFVPMYMRRKPSKRCDYEDSLSAIHIDELRKVIALMWLGGIDEFHAPECFLSRRGWESFPLTSIADALDFVDGWSRQSLLMTITRDRMYPVHCLLNGKKRIVAEATHSNS